MSSNKTGLKEAGRMPDAELGSTLLKIVGVGVAGGAALVGGAMVLGDQIAKKQVEDYERKQAAREAQKEAVREASANDYENYSGEEE